MQYNDVRTYPNGAKYLVHPLLLLVKEDRAPEADYQVRVLLEERHLVSIGQAGKARKTVSDPGEENIEENADFFKISYLPCNSLNLKLVSLKRRTSTDLENE